jgi:uncharacterized protein
MQNIVAKITGNKRYKTLVSTLKPHKWVLLVVLIWILSYLGVINWGTVKFEQNKYITVTGTSVNANENEVGRFNVSVASTNSDKENVLNDAQDKAEQIVAAAKNMGVDSKDIQTSNINVYQMEEPFFEGGRQVYRKTDWRGSIGIDITIRDVTLTDRFVDELSKLPIDSFYGPNFSVDMAQLDETRLLQLAVEDATEKANFIAGSLRKRLGGVVSVVEGSSGVSYGPRPYMAEGLGGGGIEPGSTDISKTVTVTFKLR